MFGNKSRQEFRLITYLKKTHRVIAGPLELEKCPQHKESQKSQCSCCDSGFLPYLDEITYNSINSPPAPVTSSP